MSRSNGLSGVLSNSVVALSSGADSIENKGNAGSKLNSMPTDNVWAKRMVGDSNDQPTSQVYQGGTVNVPVYKGDSQWDVVKRSLGLFADQAHLSSESKALFVEKWTNELQRSGQTSLVHNNDGSSVGDTDFTGKINRATANKGSNQIGTYPVKLTVGNQFSMINDLQDLRAIDASTASIGNPQLRSEVSNNFRQLTAGSSAERLSAAQNLMNLGAQGKPEAAKIYLALKNLTEKGEATRNAPLQMAELRMDAERGMLMTGHNDNKDARTESYTARALELVKIVEADDVPNNGTGASGKANRAEALWVNRQAAVLLNQIGNKTEGRFREMIGRFYEVEDKDRNSAEVVFGKKISRWQISDQPSMRSTTGEETALKVFRAENGEAQQGIKDLSEDPQKREFSRKDKLTVNNNGEVEQKPETTFQQEGSVKLQGEVDNEYRRTVGKGNVLATDRPYSRTPFESEEMNNQGVTRANGVAGGVAVIDEINKWTPLLADLYYGKTAQKIAKREGLEKAADSATHFPVPPKPEELPRLRVAFEQQFGKQKAALMMARLEEASNAFWKQ